MNNIRMIKLSVITLLLLMLVLSSVFSLFIPEVTFIIIPILICVVYAVPLFYVGKADVFSVWSFIFYSVLFGVLIRCLFIYFSIPDITRINQVFLLGENKSFLLPSMLLMLFGSIFMVLGFLVTSRRIVLKRKIFT